MIMDCSGVVYVLSDQMMIELRGNLCNLIKDCRQNLISPTSAT